MRHCAGAHRSPERARRPSWTLKHLLYRAFNFAAATTAPPSATAPPPPPPTPPVIPTRPRPTGDQQANPPSKQTRPKPWLTKAALKQGRGLDDQDHESDVEEDEDAEEDDREEWQFLSEDEEEEPAPKGQIARFFSEEDYQSLLCK